ncbi:MAG TPA: hypothetical protein VIN40_08325, partial [Candidatus Tyrphobacter sp.]
RRRRRGHGGAGQGLVADRHIFAVDGAGAAHATGVTAPREPSRAIAPVRKATPAIEAPPPSLSVPAEEPRAAKPARRRRPRTAAAKELETTPVQALPAPEEKPKRKRATAGATSKKKTSATRVARKKRT